MKKVLVLVLIYLQLLTNVDIVLFSAVIHSVYE